MTTDHSWIELRCLGCGRVVCRARPGDTLAISCGGCDASAPILVGGDGHNWFPASFMPGILNTGDPNRPHLEYWLGYSDHASAEKDAVVDLLRKSGITSQEECRKSRCQETFRRKREEWARRHPAQVPKPA